jgi:hypothetical protein
LSKALVKRVGMPNKRISRKLEREGSCTTVR